MCCSMVWITLQGIHRYSRMCMEAWNLGKSWLSWDQVVGVAFFVFVCLHFDFFTLSIQHCRRYKLFANNYKVTAILQSSLSFIFRGWLNSVSILCSCISLPYTLYINILILFGAVLKKITSRLSTFVYRSVIFVYGYLKLTRNTGS